MSRFDTLSDWLSWLEGLHPKAIDLGLERVSSVAKRLNLLKDSVVASDTVADSLASGCSGPLNIDDPHQVVTVAGTNGKGSCIATLEQCLLQHSQIPYQQSQSNVTVGSYTSPHLHHYCERIRLNGKPVSETLVCSAFSAIDEARGNISLTYFEFGTLAALWIFVQHKIPYVLLEVGLGGRLDAVNIVDANIAVITSIDIDHEEWLGNDREIISQEKLGVSRLSSPLIISETRLTPSLIEASERDNCLLIGRDFFVQAKFVESKLVESKCVERQSQAGDLSNTEQAWRFSMGNNIIHDLSLPSLPLGSVAAAFAALHCLDHLPNTSELNGLMSTLSLPGRFEQSSLNKVDIIYDVAHNPAAAKALALRLSASSHHYHNTYAVLGAMSDKDHQGIIEPLLKQFNAWFVGGLPNIPRAATPQLLSKALFEAKVESSAILEKPTVEQAFDSALAESDSHDRIVIFGSFYTVAAVQDLLSQSGRQTGRESGN